jgi:ABC-type transport system substrate-binding protein
VAPGQFVEMTRNEAYWDKARIPKLQKMVVIPMPEATLMRAQETFDPSPRDKILAEAHGFVVDEAPWVWIVHDLNPRAMSPKVKGFKPAQSWYQDFTSISID